MKRVLLFLITTISMISAMDLAQIRSFVTTSVTETNASYLGFTSPKETSRMTFGPAVTLSEVNSDSLATYPTTGFSSSTKTTYLPILVDGTARCFAVIDSTGKAVSLGYTKLAQELSQTAQQNGIALNDIKLYRSTQINSYLISIPTNSRSANLIILQPNWNTKSRAGYPSESETIDQIRRAGGSK